MRRGPAALSRAAVAAAPAAGEVGPNAVTQLIAALPAAGLGDLTAAIFASAGTGEWLSDPPSVMVDERRVARLHQAVRAALLPRQAAAVLSGAGRLTADYLLRVRIPRPARFVLKLLPAPLSAALLVPAIRAHAWTFAGSGQFTGRAGPTTFFELTDNPFCAGEFATAPVCAWHAAVFQRLFAVLVSSTAEVAETRCEACGDDCCRFTVDW